MVKGGPKTDFKFSNFGPVLMNNALRFKNWFQNNRFLHISHQHTSPTHDTNQVYHRHMFLKSEVFVSIFATRMVRSAQELYAIEKMAVA